jgi:hypothetical protein
MRNVGIGVGLDFPKMLVLLGQIVSHKHDGGIAARSATVKGHVSRWGLCGKAIMKVEETTFHL